MIISSKCMKSVEVNELIIIEKGDLLNRGNGCHFILHQANSESIMGKGIAEKIAFKYPLAAKVDREFPHQPEDRLGKYSIAKIEEAFYVVNLYGQLLRGKPNSKQELKERYHHLGNSLRSFLLDLKKKQRIEGVIYKVGLPYKIGSDMAGGNWERILGILIDVSEDLKIDLHLYKYEDRPK